MFDRVICHGRAERVLLYVAIAVVIAYAAIFAIAPLSGEDFGLTKDFGHDGWGERLQWVAARSSAQMSDWNARLGEQLAIFWLSVPRAYFVAAQTLAFIGLCFLSATFAERRNWTKQTVVAITLIFAVWPRMETFFWSTAAAEYLQPILLCLFVLRSYSTLESLERLERSNLLWMATILASLFAGFSFENVPPAMILFMGGSVLLRRRLSLSFRSVSPIIAVSLTWLALMLAHSTAQRRAFYASALNVPQLTPEYLISRIPEASIQFFSSANTLTALALICTPLAYLRSRDRLRFVMLFGVIILIALSVVAAPYIEPRAFILAWAVMLYICTFAITEAIGSIRYGTAIYAGAAILMLGFPLITEQHYRAFGIEAEKVDHHIRAARLTSACDDGIPVHVVDVNFPVRYLSPRNDWYMASPEQVGAYYGCKILIR